MKRLSLSLYCVRCIYYKPHIVFSLGFFHTVSVSTPRFLSFCPFCFYFLCLIPLLHLFSYIVMHSTFIFLQYYIFVLISYLFLVNFAFVFYLPYWLSFYQTNGVSKFIHAFCLRFVYEKTLTQSFNFASFLPLILP